ncbi:MAG TPA: CDP-alcohol phosphatidyltransferase family protein [Thermoanaerobaculia bacterium]|nr:CDP-alcohol phosphatidyltransferase family protein [Thermoanaerobaculia bacterium]
MHPWRERLSRWLAPMARRCPVSPNAISIIALLLNLTAAGLLYSRWFLVAIVFIAIGGTCDAFDGIVAREQQRATRFGDFLDHVLDRVSDSALAAGWMIGSGVGQDLTILAVIGIMLNGYIGTQIEASYGQRNYDSVGRGEFVLALIVFPIVSFILLSNGWSEQRYAALTIADWMTVLLILFALLGIVQRMALASRLERSR